jgi:hypothetical protein
MRADGRTHVWPSAPAGTSQTMVVLAHADLALGAPAAPRGWAALDAELAARIARGAGMALAAVLIPGYAARCGCAPISPGAVPRRTA